MKCIDNNQSESEIMSLNDRRSKISIKYGLFIGMSIKL